MKKAYIFITIKSGETKEAIQKIKEVPGVVAVEAVMGPYDSVALVESENTNDIGEIVVSGIQKISGVRRTLTNLVVDI